MVYKEAKSKNWWYKFPLEWGTDMGVHQAN
jgi:hypothetical protein